VRGREEERGRDKFYIGKNLMTIYSSSKGYIYSVIEK
jgi:hypothetical protein